MSGTPLSAALDTTATAIEIAINRLLDADPHLVTRLRALDGRIVDIGFAEFPMPLRLQVMDGRFDVAASGTAADAADVTLTASTPTFARAALDPGLRGAGLAAAGIDVRGDTEVAEALVDILRDAEVDFEEPLSRFVGDAAAQRIGQFVRDLFGRGRSSMTAAGEDAVRYLRDESGDLVPRDEIEQWMDAVDSCRMTVDRVAARIDILESRLADQ